MTRQRGSESAFTLTEMLVVIGIIAVLAAIIVPVYNGVAEKADKVKCAAHLQQVGIAQTMYRNDKKRHAASLFEVAAGGYLTNKDEAGCPADQETPSALTAKRPTQLGGRDLLERSSYEWAEYLGAEEVIWNYWGYRVPAAATDAQGIEFNPYTGSPYYQHSIGAPSPPLSWPSGIPSWEKYPCLANRNCPGTTIVTHCVYHRASALSDPTGDDLDIVLLKDGSVKSDVKAAPYDWVTQP